MPEYQVAWTIDIDASSPQDAARECRRILMDPASTATILTVTDGEGNEIDIDWAGDAARQTVRGDAWNAPPDPGNESAFVYRMPDLTLATWPSPTRHREVISQSSAASTVNDALLVLWWGRIWKED